MTSECGGCGSTLADRKNYRERNAGSRAEYDSIPVDTCLCPHCGAQKCCQCDMGDDVQCNGCESDGEQEDGGE
jgi:hypothetical protein